MIRSHSRILLVLCVLLVATMLMTGCQQKVPPGSEKSDSGETDAPTEFVAYTSDTFGFAAQFPAGTLEDHSSEELHWFDSFSPPPNYVPRSIVVPRTMVRVSLPASSSEKGNPMELYEEWQLQDMLGSDVKGELPSLLMRSTGHLNPSIEIATRSGHPSARTIFSVSDSEQTVWCYVTVVYGNDGRDFWIAGTRDTEDQAVAAEASFRILDASEASDASEPIEPQNPNGAGEHYRQQQEEDYYYQQQEYYYGE
ncbi:MAG: hypothetical protein PF636_00010 [Actinomycetota bacterium]|jgi:hypothetical protein|nr:hypothetical protein [Actinomycetota bacterium]